MNDLQSRLSKISKSPAVKEIKQQTTVVRSANTKSKPGPKSTWKDPHANYVRIYTQLQDVDRNALKSSVAGGKLHGKFESVDHFINEAVVLFMKAHKLNPQERSSHL